MRTTPQHTRWPAPGTPVFVTFLLVFRHYGIVSDLWVDGVPMVISNSRRRGGVAEESWTAFAGGRSVRVASHLRATEDPRRVVERARAWLGRDYSVTTRNCDHHVRHALGLSVESPQLQITSGLAATVAAIGLLARVRQ